MSSVIDSIKSFPFLENEKHIAVALSGGADSMALFKGLCMLKNELGITLSAIHINHQLRGEESFRDENFVRKQCKIENVPLTVVRVDVHKKATEEKISTELAARYVRYEAFDTIECDALATAHNADDNLETVLFRLTRSTGLSGLCGIPQRRGKLIRPLLNVSREEVEEFCFENAIPYVTDSTNLSDDFTRNRIRHSVVPVMKSLNPSILNSFAKTLDLISEDREYIDSVASEEFRKRNKKDGLDITDFSDLPKAIASRIIGAFLELYGFGGYTNLKGTLNVVLGESSKFSLNREASVKVQYPYLKFVNDVETCEFSVVMEETDIENLKINGKVNNLLLKNAIDCDKIVGKPIIRTRISGDFITFSHRNVSKPLRKWMNEENINPALRDKIPVISDDDGVIWVYGGGVDKRVLPTETTKRVLKVICEEKQSDLRKDVRK